MLQPVEWIKMFYAAFVDSQAKILEFDYYDHWNISMESLSTGTFLDTLRTNLWDGQIFSLAWAWGAGRFFQTASLFIIGMVAGRQRWFEDNPVNRKLWARVLAIALLLFFPLYGLSSLIPDFARQFTPEEAAGTSIALLKTSSFMTPLMLVINSLHKCCFMLVIVTSLLFAFYTTRLSRPMRFIMPYGRMSLTNYITQSIIGAAIYYHWGLHLNPCDTQSIALGIVILTAQILFCRWWMRSHSHGPLEGIWKRLTYAW